MSLLDGSRGPWERGSSAAERALSISQLNRLAKGLLEEAIGEVWLTGEISDYKAYPSGHWYFTLKDAESAVGAVMFSGRNRACRVRPVNGLQVLVRGRVSLWEKTGKFQVVVEELQPAGEGALFVALEKLKARLLAEGLFAQERKRALPRLPRRVGIATSTAGAALRDILKVLHSRGSRVHVVVASCRVQGEGSADEIACALARLDALGSLDVVIVGRGGGSLEDLWSFNEEAVVRAIAAMSVPVISAVGHEVDVTLADLAADVRAATPSQAAELVCASFDELSERVAGARRRLAQAARGTCGEVRARLAASQPSQLLLLLRGAVESRAQRTDDLRARLARTGRQLVRSRRAELDGLSRRLSPVSLRGVVQQRRRLADDRQRALVAAARRLVQRKGEALGQLVRAREALSPLAVLERGYSVLLTEQGRAVRAAREVSRGQPLVARLHEGSLTVSVDHAHAPEGET